MVPLLPAVHQPPEQLRAAAQRVPTAAPWTQVGFPAWHRDGRDLGAARTSVLGTALGRDSRGWGSLPPLTSSLVGSFGLWLATGVQCLLQWHRCEAASPLILEGLNK